MDHPDLRTPLAEEELERIEHLLREVTPPPWKWYASVQDRLLELRSLSPWKPVVMSFGRWGITSFQARFRQKDGPFEVMHPASAMLTGEGEATVVNHPDARFLVEARSLVPLLVSEVRRCWELLEDQKAEITRLERMLGGKVSGAMEAVRLELKGPKGGR